MNTSSKPRRSLLPGSSSPLTRLPLALLPLALGACAGAGRPATPTSTPDWARTREQPLVAPLEADAPEEAGASTSAGEGVPLDLTRPLAPPGAGSPARPGARGGRPAAGPAPALPEGGRSRLERLYAGESGADAANRRLDQFGYATFRADSDLAASPAPPDYPLGPGDEVIVTITGSFEEFVRRTVDQDGQVALPRVGALPVAGLLLRDLAPRLRQAYAIRYKGFELSASLGRLRTVQVELTGRVERPGTLRVPACSSLLGLLSQAGGVRKDGSLRRVILRRAGQERRLDLYELLLGGDTTRWPRVLEGDRLHVPEIGPTLAVAGLVRRPAIYELLDTLELGAALDLAGGLTPFSFTPRVQVEGSDGRRRALRDVELDAAGRAEPLRDGELVLVGALGGRVPVVRVQGEVLRPGNYEFRPGLRVSQLLRRAEGLTLEAFSQAFLSRRLETVQQGDGETRRRTRRVLVIDLARALAGDARHDIELQPLDLLSVRPRRAAEVLPTVWIEGAVRQPGRYERTQGLRVSHLLALAGNPLPDAADELELVREVEREGQLDVARYRLTLARVRAGDPRHDALLRERDRLVLRRLRRVRVAVSISGEVRRPGRYTFPQGARISDLIRAAGGVLEGADLRASVFTRESVRRLQQERFRHLLERSRQIHETALEDLVREGHANEAVAGKLSLDRTQRGVRRDRELQATGRVVVPLSRPGFPGSDHDLRLEEGDRLVVARRHRTVSVVGLVFNPATFVAERGITVEQVLDRAGGLLEDGDDERIYVIRADGNVESMAQRRDPLELEDPLLPGDVVLVPRRPAERSVKNQLADGLALSRQMAELALIASKAANPASSVQLNSSVERGDPFARSPAGYERELLRGREAR